MILMILILMILILMILMIQNLHFLRLLMILTLMTQMIPHYLILMILHFLILILIQILMNLILSSLMIQFRSYVHILSFSFPCGLMILSSFQSNHKILIICVQDQMKMNDLLGVLGVGHGDCGLILIQNWILLSLMIGCVILNLLNLLILLLPLQVGVGDDVRVVVVLVGGQRELHHINLSIQMINCVILNLLNLLILLNLPLLLRVGVGDHVRVGAGLVGGQHELFLMILLCCILMISLRLRLSMIQILSMMINLRLHCKMLSMILSMMINRGHH